MICFIRFQVRNNCICEVMFLIFILLIYILYFLLNIQVVTLKRLELFQAMQEISLQNITDYLLQFILQKLNLLNKLFFTSTTGFDTFYVYSYVLYQK